MPSLESIRRAPISESPRRISIQTLALGVDLVVLSFRGREYSAFPRETADETSEQFSSVFSAMRSICNHGFSVPIAAQQLCLSRFSRPAQAAPETLISDV